jgi:hypothetical protein
MDKADPIDPNVSHAMTLAVCAGIISALKANDPQFPWTMSEQLSLIREDDLSATERAGLDLARKWVWEEFTKYAPPD